MDKLHRFFFIAALLAATLHFSCKPADNRVQFASIDEVIQHTFPQSYVQIDTIAENSNLSEFVYDDDSIVLEKLYTPMFPDYDETDSGHLEPIVDTPYINYGQKRWELPLSWKSSRMNLDLLLHIKTKNKRYLALIFTDPSAIGALLNYNVVGLIDLDSETGICRILAHSATAANFLDYDNDGVLEFLHVKNKTFVVGDNNINETYEYVLCRLTEDVDNPEIIYTGSGAAIGIDIAKAAGKYLITDSLNIKK